MRYIYNVNIICTLSTIIYIIIEFSIKPVVFRFTTLLLRILTNLFYYGAVYTEYFINLSLSILYLGVGYFSESLKRDFYDMLD